jgi:hypothetical protein
MMREAVSMSKQHCDLSWGSARAVPLIRRWKPDNPTRMIVSSSRSTRERRGRERGRKRRVVEECRKGGRRGCQTHLKPSRRVKSHCLAAPSTLHPAMIAGQVRLWDTRVSANHPRSDEVLRKPRLRRNSLDRHAEKRCRG